MASTVGGSSIPQVAAGDPILEVTELKKFFVTRSRVLKRPVAEVRAVDGVDILLRAGETLGIVGESGSGKSTTGHAILRLIEPTEGQVLFKGQDLTRMTRPQLQHSRRNLQVVFQDPYASLNPRLAVRQIVAEPLRIHGLYDRSSSSSVMELIERVGLDASYSDRFPVELSGGQRQRVAIARALALRPEVIILDEPVSALDVSIQAQVVNLLLDLQKSFGLSYIFISHDLSVVGQVADRVAVMYAGRVIEEGTSDQVLQKPMHPFTQALLAAVPVSHPALRKSGSQFLAGDRLAAEPIEQTWVAGCPFRDRCRRARSECVRITPELKIRRNQDNPTRCPYSGSESISDELDNIANKARTGRR